MSKRVGSGLRTAGSVGAGRNETSSGPGVVDLADARVRLRSGHPSNETLIEEIDEVAFASGSGSLHRSTLPY